MHWVGPQGKAYRVSGDEKYVNSWIEVYGDFLRQYPDAEANELGTYDPLPVAERLSGAIDAFFYFLNSVNFTPEWLSTYLVALYDQVEYITNHYYGASSGTGNNITVAQEVTVFKSALMFPELTAAQEWLTDGSTRLAADVENQFLDDGFLWEVDLSYHIGTVANFHDAMLMAEANGKTSLLPSTFVESLRKATEVVMNLTYPDYSVEELSSDVNMHRMNLYRKLQSLVGMTPSEFIRTIRLKKAAQILSERPDISISELADMVGFNTPKYLTRYFKEMFGCTPSQYAGKL